MTRAGRPSHPAPAAAATFASRTAAGAADAGSSSAPPVAGRGNIGPVAALLITSVRAYQRWISPMLPPSCRFYPSCSTYAVTALTRHGAVRGTALAIWRLLRCHPFNPGGVDPVPERTVESAPAAPAQAKTR